MEAQPEESKVDKAIRIIKEMRIEPFLFLFMFALSIREVTLQSVIMESTCRLRLNYTQDICEHLDKHKVIKQTIQKITMHYKIGMMLIATVPALFCATFLSPWSDRYGRKFPIMIALFGIILEGIGTTIVASIPTAPMFLLILTHIPSGLFGGYLVAITITYTYMSDVTTPESRAIRFAVLEFGFMIASPLGIAIGGLIYKYYGSVPVLSTSVAVYGICFLWVFFVVKETRGLNESKNPKEMLKHLFTLKNLKETVQTCIAKRPGTIRAQIWLIILAATIGLFCVLGSMTIGYLFADAMYNWSNPQYSTVSAITKFFQGLAVLIAIPVFTKVLYMPESSIAIVGSLSYSAENIIKAAAYEQWMYYYASVSGILGGVTSVAIRSRISKMVTRNELSKVFSLLALCEAMTPALGALLFGNLYEVSLANFPGASYLLAALLLLIQTMIFMWIKKQGPPPTTHELNEGGYRMESFAETK